MEDLSFEEIEKREAAKDPQRDVIRVQTDRWVDCHGQLIIKKTIRQMGSDVCDSSLAGIDGLKDGLYELFVKWAGTDCETGYIDDIEFGFREIES